MIIGITQDRFFSSFTSKVEVLELAPKAISAAYQNLRISSALSIGMHEISHFVVKEGIRAVILEVFSRSFRKVLPDTNVEVLSCRIKLAALVSLVATAVLFGSVYLACGARLASVIVFSLRSVVFGVLMHHYGLTTRSIVYMVRDRFLLSQTS